jgi:hypothetical protein
MQEFRLRSAHLLLVLEAQVVRPQQRVPEGAGAGQALRAGKRPAALPVSCFLPFLILIIDCACSKKHSH